MKKTILFLLTLYISYIFYISIVYTINGFNPVIVITIILFFLIYIIRNNYSIKELIPYDLGMLLIFVIYTLISGSIVTPDFSSFISMEWIMIPATFISIAISFMIGRSKSNSNIFIVILLVSTSLLSLKLIFDGNIAGYSRITIGEVNVNEIANIINIGFIAIMFLWAESRKSNKIVYVLVAIIQIVGIVYTGSRKSFIGVLVLLLVCFLLSRFFAKKTNIKKMIGGFILISICVLVISNLVPLFLDNTIIGGRLISKDAGDTLRIYLYNEAYKLFLQHPLFGVGIRGFQFYYGMYSHSTYAELLSCTGIFGTLLYISIYFIQWKKLSEILHNSTDKLIIARVQVLRSIIVFMAYLGITMIHFYGLYSYILIGFISGYIAQYSDVQCKDNKNIIMKAG